MYRLTRLTRCRSQYVTTALQCVLRRTGVLPYKHYFSQGSHLSFSSKSSISSTSQRARHSVLCQAQCIHPYSFVPNNSIISAGVTTIGELGKCLVFPVTRYASSLERATS